MGRRLSDAAIEREFELSIAEQHDRARNGLLNFIRAINPAYEINWHHRLICRVLNKVFEGEIDRLLITAPPRSGKSEIVSRNFPAWTLGRNPDTEFMAASHTAKFAQKLSRDVQRIMDHPEYRQIFPDTRLKGQASSFAPRTNRHGEPMKGEDGNYIRTSELFEVVGRRGYYLCAGVGGGLTGSGGDMVSADDPIKTWEQAASQVYRDKIWDWWTSVLMTRLSKHARVILTLTRWNHDDVAGRLTRLMASDPDADQYTIIHLPAIKKGEPTSIDPRKDGEALWPERQDKKKLQRIKATMGPRKFGALYDNDPAPDGGNVVDRKWWKRYGRAELPDAFERVILSADLAFKGGKDNDWTVFQVWGVVGTQKYLLHQVRGQMHWPKQKSQFKVLALSHEPGIDGKWIEDAANAAALVSEMKEHVPGTIAVPVGKTSKLARAMAVSDDIMAGNVWLPKTEDAPWIEEFVLEWERFPNGDNDDQVDACSQFLLRINKTFDINKLLIGGDTKASLHF